MSGSTSRVWSRRSLLGAAAALAGSACVAEAARRPARESVGHSGVRGITVVDEGCPPLPTQSACPSHPFPARLRFVRKDLTVPEVDVRSREDGTFTVRLAPGSYDLLSENLSRAPYPQADPMTVEVPEDRFTVITVPFDSGVR